MKLENGKFIYAYYATPNKDTILGQWYDNETEETEWWGIDVDLSSDMYRKVLDTFTIDQINSMSYDQDKKERQGFTDLMVSLGQQYGLLYDPDAEDKFAGNTFTIDHIFNPPAGTEGEDLLFNTKLTIFDLDEVNNSNNTALKKELREATTPLQAIYIAGKFLYE